jgi:hypothetical protein
MRRMYIFCIAFLGWSLTACDESDTASIPLLNEIVVGNRLREGNWRITNFTHQSINKTANYTGVIFDFDALSVVLNNTQTLPVAGSWGITDEGFEGQPELVFNMALTSVEPRFIAISDDWDIIESTVSKLRLKDENIESSTIDYLTFEKN